MRSIRRIYRGGDNDVVTVTGLVGVTPKRENRPASMRMGNDNGGLSQPPERGAIYPPPTPEERQKFYAGMRAK